MKIELIIPKGTQIVLLNEVKVLNENRLYPKGTVGKVCSVPIDSTHAYKIEFSDKSFGTAKRKEFSIRKHFPTEQSGLISPLENSDLYEFVIYRCIVGSKAFGLDDENSDTDLRGIFLPPADLHWSVFGVPEQIENKENEAVYWELHKFLTLALKANPNILETLYTPLVEYKNEIAEELLAIRSAFLSKLVYQTYNGYVMSQFKKLEQDLRNHGEIKWKHQMHLIRLLLQGVEMMRYSDLNVCVEENRDKLLAIKRGEINWETVNEWRLSLHKDFENAFGETKLPERPDYERANKFLIKARRAMI